MIEQTPNTLKPDESPWITAIQHGDLSVFSAIYEAYGDEIYAFIVWKCGNRTLAEDLMSDVMIKAFSNIRRCCQAASPNIRARLYSIARNRVIDEFKRSKSGVLHPDIPIESNDPSPIEITNTAVLTQNVLSYLHELGSDIHELFILRFRQQLSYQEIASINGKSIDNNKKIYSRTLKKIKHHFHSFTTQHE